MCCCHLAPDRPNRGADVLILTGVHSGGNLLPCLADGFADGVVDEPNAYLRSDTGGRRSVRARRRPARTELPVEIEGGSAARRNARARRRAGGGRGRGEA